MKYIQIYISRYILPIVLIVMKYNQIFNPRLHRYEHCKYVRQPTLEQLLSRLPLISNLVCENYGQDLKKVWGHYPLWENCGLAPLGGELAHTPSRRVIGSWCRFHEWQENGPWDEQAAWCGASRNLSFELDCWVETKRLR